MSIDNMHMLRTGNHARVMVRSVLGDHTPPEMLRPGDVVIVLEPEMTPNKTRVITAEGKIGWFFSDELVRYGD